MRKYLPAVMMFLLACNNHPVKDAQISEVHAGKSKDTVVHVKDTVIHVKDTLPSLGEEFEGMNLDTVLNQTIRGYKQPYLMDSVFTMDGNVFQLHLKHFCLMDSGIKVPRYYTEMYKLDSFITHNYVTQVRLEKNGMTILERTVYKKDFEKVLAASLRKYAVLLSPSLSLRRDTINLHYSISIPLTDVGVGATMVVNNDGTVEFKGQYY